ncbi:MAG: isoamylase early set domain-containing protein [Flavobacteriales bacterium]|nr:isoamylase early set domain-containing protein [Flavobacteriales bacterium]
MIKKQFLKSKPVCKVTFSMPAEAAPEAKEIQLVGEFSEWTKSPIEMKKLKNGSFKTTVNLETGKEYEFRYVIDGERWENDWEADAYRQSPIAAEENSVVSL